MPVDDPRSDADVRARVGAHAGWYYRIDVAAGVVTPGPVDPGRALHWLPWPNVRRKRCLDLGTVDGFYAFELERKGAAEVVAVDVDEDRRAAGDATSTRRERFNLAADIIGSKAQWRSMSVYDLDPSRIGQFDVIVCAGLLRQLRDPIRALTAIRSVAGGPLLSVEPIELWLSLFGRGRPLIRLDGTSDDDGWFKLNGTAHKQLLTVAGFEIERLSKPFVVPSGRDALPSSPLAERLTQLATRAVTGDTTRGVLHRALLGRPSE